MKKLKTSIQGVLISLLLILFLGSGVSADTVLPDDNSDLIKAKLKLLELKSITSRCSEGDCPQINCETARQLNEELRELNFYARYNYYWLRVAAKKSLDVFEVLKRSEIRDAERAAKLQMIAAYQEYVLNIAGLMLDLSSAAGGLESLLKDPKTLDKTSGAEFISNVDTLYETLKSLETADAKMRSEANGEEIPNRFNLEDPDLNDLKSHLSDVKTIYDEAISTGGDWKTALKSGKSVRSLGQILGRVLKNVAEDDLAARKQRAQELLNDVSAAERTASSQYRDYVKYANRRDLAEDLVIALKELYEPESGNSWATCTGRMSIGCGSFDIVANGTVPDYAMVQFFGERIDLARSKDDSRWGPAIIFLTGAMNSHIDRLSAIRINEVRPSLQFSKASYKPGEKVTVKYMAPCCIGKSSWFGVIESAKPHGDARSNSRNTKIRFPVGSLGTEQILEFEAPEQDGQYDLRLNDTGSSEELLSESFSVVSDEAKSLSGLWRYQDGSLIRISQVGDEVVGILEKASTTLINVFGFKNGEISFRGKIKGGRIDALNLVKFPLRTKRKCPEKWENRVPMTLTVSADWNKLTGEWRREYLDIDSCTIAKSDSAPAAFERIEEQ